MIAIESVIGFAFVCCCRRHCLGWIGGDGGDDARKKNHALVKCEPDPRARVGASRKESGGRDESDDQKEESAIEIVSGEMSEKKKKNELQEAKKKEQQQ